MKDVKKEKKKERSKEEYRTIYIYIFWPLPSSMQDLSFPTRD